MIDCLQIITCVRVTYWQTGRVLYSVEEHNSTVGHAICLIKWDNICWLTFDFQATLSELDSLQRRDI